MLNPKLGKKIKSFQFTTNKKNLIKKKKIKKKVLSKNNNFPHNKMIKILNKPKSDLSKNSINNFENINFFKDKKLNKLQIKKDNLLNKNVQKRKIKKNNEKIYNSISKTSRLLSDYLSIDSDENVAIQGSEKFLNSISKFSQNSKKFSQYNKKRKLKKQPKKIDKINKKINKRKAKLEYKDKLSNLYNNTRYNQKSFFKKLIQKRKIKKSIYQKYKIDLKSKLKNNIKKTALISSKIIINNMKRIGFALAFFAIGFIVIFSLFSSFLGIFSTSSNMVITTTYLAPQEKLILINQSYSTKELNLENELNRIKTIYKGYDEYILPNNLNFSHDPHLILSYITAKYGEAENMTEVEIELDSIFNSIYKIEYSEEIETRYKEEKKIIIDEFGKEKEKIEKTPYKYKKLIVNFNKNDLKKEILNRLKLYPDNVVHFESLLDSKGNMEDFFGNSSSPLSPHDISNIYDFDVSGGTFPPPNPHHVATLNGGYPGQCTWYVYNRFSQLGKPIQHSPMGNGGDWAFYAQNYGYSVSRIAKSGMAMSFPNHVPGSSIEYGHIAFVEKVNEDGSVVISEMNVIGEYIISTRVISPDIASQCYFIDFGL